MIFDSKTCFYYTIKNSENINDADILSINKVMGDYSFTPGALKKEEINENSNNYVFEDLYLENPNFICIKSSYNPSTGILINGLLNIKPIRFNVSYINAMEKICLIDFTIIEEDEGIHLFSNHVFNPDSALTGPCYEFYDAETLKVLKQGFGYSEKEVLDLNTYKLFKLGFKPDKRITEGIFEDGNMFDFAHNIFTKYSLEELKSQLNGMSNNNSTAKHLSLENKTNE